MAHRPTRRHDNVVAVAVSRSLLIVSSIMHQTRVTRPGACHSSSPGRHRDRNATVVLVKCPPPPMPSQASPWWVIRFMPGQRHRHHGRNLSTCQSYELRGPWTNITHLLPSSQLSVAHCLPRPSGGRRLKAKASVKNTSYFKFFFQIDFKNITFYVFMKWCIKKS